MKAQFNAIEGCHYTGIISLVLNKSETSVLITICFHLQVVGNLIYYRYMNPAIVAPDAFDIVAFGVDKGLTPDQVVHASCVICY